MTTPSSGAISMSNINVELAYSSTAQISLNDTAVRNLLGRGTAASTISLNDGYGKSSMFKFNISGDRINLYNAAIAAGWNGSSKVQATLTADIYSTSTATAALYIGSFPAGVVVLLNGFSVVGAGGVGGMGRGGSVASDSGGTGGLGLLVDSSNSGGVWIDNSGNISGGGGGGGGGGSRAVAPVGGRAYGGSASGVTGGGGGGGGGYGGGGSCYSGTSASGSFGSTGGILTGGAGGAGGYYSSSLFGGAGGNGGSYAASGGDGVSGTGGNVIGAPGLGGAAGAATSGSGYVTWSGAGNFYGARN